MSDNKTTPATKENSNTLFTQVLAKVSDMQKNGAIVLPKDYSASNAIQSAFLIISETKTSDKKPVLEACTKESVAKALLKMVTFGLSPLKKQCDFILYGNELTCSIEYTGNIALAKRFGGLKSIIARTVYKGEEYNLDIADDGTMSVKHFPNPEHWKMDISNITGAYAIATLVDGSKNTTFMTADQILRSWQQGAMKGNSPAHKNFTDQMCEKTVISRACKLLIRSSDDSALNLAAAPEITEDANATVMSSTIIEADNKAIAEGSKTNFDFDNEGKKD